MNGFCPLASGSKGNALFLGTKKSKILIDAGIGYKDLIERLSKIGEDLETIDAILITHDHSDHIDGLKTILAKVDLPIFANLETAKGICLSLNIMPHFKIFSTNEPFEFKDLTIFPFTIQHDTLDPVGFVIKHENFKLGICTDLGLASSFVKNSLMGCDYLYLESNHDVDMLFASKRPQHLKKRIMGRQGHLSNKECANLLESILHPNLKEIYLAHISSECNNSDLAKKLIQDLLAQKNLKINVSIAFQDKISNSTFFE